MDVREKLIDLLTGHSIDTQQDVEYVADHLIANGVTVQENVEISDELLKQLKNAQITICKEEPSIALVQEWISVDERLPEKDGQYLIFTTQYFTPDHIDEIDHKDGIEISGYSKRFGFLSKNGLYAKYWCEMPQPPKGE